MFQIFTPSYKTDLALIEIKALIKALETYKVNYQQNNNTELNNAIASLKHMVKNTKKALIDAHDMDEKDIILRHINLISNSLLLARGESLQPFADEPRPPISRSIPPANRAFTGIFQGGMFIGGLISSFVIAAVLAASIAALIGGITLLPISMPLAICTIAVASLSIFVCSICLLKRLPTVLFCGNNGIQSRTTALHESNIKDFNIAKDYINGLPEDVRVDILKNKTDKADSDRIETVSSLFGIS